MAAFSYSAINASGLELTGELHAPDHRAERLASRGFAGEQPWTNFAASGDDAERLPKVNE